MPDRELTESGVFMWSRERELVPVYDRLAVLGATTECIAEIQELCAAHKDKIADCDACTPVEESFQKTDVGCSLPA